MSNRLILVFALAALVGIAREPTRADEPLKETDLKDNVEVRLVAARRSEKRTVHLIAKFETTGKDKREILVEFHSNIATPHERTLMSLVEACVGGCGGGAGPEWNPAIMEGVFSVPKAGIDGRDRKEYEKCYLVSLKSKKDK